MLDVLYNTVLGQHAAGLVLLAYAMTRLASVFILFPLWQSTIALIPAWACAQATAHDRAELSRILGSLRD